MTHTIAFAHFKGGTGKTTSCLSIAGYLAKNGAKVLAVDLDPQSNLTSGLGVDQSNLKNSTFHIMSRRKRARAVIVPTKIENLDIAPATPYLVHATLRKYERKDDAMILRNAIKRIKSIYDYILVDTPTSNGHFIVNGVTASDSVVMVLDEGTFSLKGIDSFKKVFNSYCGKLGLRLNIAMALVSKCDKSLLNFGKKRYREVKKAAEEILGTTVHTIPYSDHIHESQKLSVPISHYKPNSRVGKAYMNVIGSIIDLK
ncbi:MAG: AAA family ATPase [Candidatus Woesearchaeota archaeon]|nr:AAA family ATPase [Candidatus Woesearchaeota archaeon]